MARQAMAVHESMEILDHPMAQEQFAEQLQRLPNLGALHDEAKNRGFADVSTPEESFAIRLTSRASAGGILPPPGLGIMAAPVQSVDFSLVGRSLTRGNDQGAVATMSVSASGPHGGEQVSYSMLLEAPSGHFDRAKEWTIDNGRVVEAHSWWSAWNGCLHSKCASTCLSSLWQCTGTWSAYFWCVAAKCGGCVVKCAACATCDCRWWCRWAAGCCDA